MDSSPTSGVASSSSNIKIKKRNRSDEGITQEPVKNNSEDADIPKSTHLDEHEDVNGNESSHFIRKVHHEDETEAFIEKAREDLKAFLRKKGVDPAQAKDIKILVKRSKTRKGGETSYSVQYVDATNSIYASKSDVYLALAQKPNEDISPAAAFRQELHREASERLAAVADDLPHTFDGIKVYNFGNIVANEMFHNTIKVYPVGYKCEMDIDTSHSRRYNDDTHTLLCEIFGFDDEPEFVITVKSSGKVFIAATEAEAWKKVETDFSYQGAPLSFFNLDIELLIEGLPGILDCSSYIFHRERGYGDVYNTNDEALAMTTSFLNKRNRAARNRNRQEIKVLSADERKVIAEEKKKRKELEEEQRREKAAAEKERREKDRQAALERKSREKERSKRSKEEIKREEKQRQQLRKDIHSDLRRARTEAHAAVVQYFDTEEETFEQEQHVRAILLSDIMSNDSLDVVLRNIQKDEDHSVVMHKDFEQALEVTSALYVFRHLLQLRITYVNDQFLLKDDLPSEVPTSKEDIDAKECVPEINTVEEAGHNTHTDATESKMEFDSQQHDVKVPENDQRDMEVVPTASTADVVEEVSTDAVEEVNKSGEAMEPVIHPLTEVDFDVIQLNLIRCMVSDLHAIMNLTEKDVDPKGRRASGGLIPLPLNQLTWHEIARMLIIITICKELERSEDDALCAIKGSKNAIFRSNKNIVRNIRYRMVQREYGDHLATPVKDMWCKYTSTSPFISMDVDSDVDMSSESSLIAAVTDASNNESYSEMYRRCAKVWLRITNMSQAKHLMWEVDSIEYPEYYEAIQHPMMLCNVALKLLKRVYPDDEVAMAFYSDMRQILVNCFVYYTEFTLIHGQAQRLLHALYRHMCRWVWADPLPPLESCDDQHCLLSSIPIVQQSGEYTSVKCGRCNGVFSLTELQDYAHDHFLIQPSEEQVMQLHEEWICLYCLQDDSLKSESVNSREYYYADEWGPSALVPWFLDEKELARSENPVVSKLHNALQILSTVYLTPIPNVLNVNQSLAYITWSMNERVTVINALCEVLKGHNAGYAYLSQRHNECMKLSRLSLKEPFCEGEFVDQVKLIAGDEGMLAYRSLMDGSSGDSEQDLQYRVIEGRCIICKGSTFEDDCPGEAVLLCDGCNAETHLDCLQLDKVPKGAWYCEPCQKRIDSRENAVDNDFANIDIYRNSDMENALIDEALTCRQRNISENNLLVCEYCGQNEYDTCSPMVYGQSRYEFEIYVGQCSVKCVDNLIPNKIRTSLRFNVLQEDIPEPALKVPYFPRVTTTAARKKFSGTSCPVVHELCALYMFQSRVQRARHAVRRKRRIVAERITQMSGIATKPLGKDSRGRLYWTFPQEESLYISPGEGDQTGQWIKITNSLNIIKIIDSLNSSNRQEEMLQKNLSLFYQYLTAKSRQISTEQLSVQEMPEEEKEKDEEASQTSSAPVMKSQRLSEGKPTQLRLNTDKGYDVLKQYVIKQENIFEDRDMADDGDDEEETAYQDYFHFSKGARYYALGLFDCYDKIVKLPKTSRVTVTFQIHKDGQMLAYTPLSEQWGDGYYYFSTLVFKRSGKYTISFIVEGITAVNIPPVVYTVNVITERYNCGISSAHGRLNAYQYMGLGDRHASSRRRELFSEVHHAADEIQAVRSALIAVYLALPHGALISAPESEERGEVVANIAEATGWNSSLDQMWRAAVLAAQTPLALMECALVLEHYIARQWLSVPHMRLFSALPNAHFALRCVTCSSVALRVYCLDRCVLYDKVQALPRGTRQAEVRSRSDIPRPSMSSSRRSRGTARDIDSDSEDESRSSRPRRGAMARAQAQMRSQFESDNDSEITSSRSLRDRTPKPVGPVSWACETCGVENEARARSCATCGERKPAASAGKPIRTGRRRRDESDDSSDDVPSKRRKTSESEDELELSDSEEVAPPLDFDNMLSEKPNESLAWKELHILFKLQQDERSNVFWEAVDEDIYPDYRDFIEEPMDLRTIAERVNVGYYGDDVNEFIRCVNLVWKNCQKYNQEGSVIYDYSIGLSDMFNTLVKDYNLVVSEDVSPPADVAVPTADAPSTEEHNVDIIADVTNSNAPMEEGQEVDKFVHY